MTRNAPMPCEAASGSSAVAIVLSTPAARNTKRAPKRVYSALKGNVLAMLASPTAYNSRAFSAAVYGTEAGRTKEALSGTRLETS